MATTPQTNASLKEIAELMVSHDNYVVCGHVSPDGDCLGSQLALACALKQLGKNVTCVLVKDEPIESALRFLPGIDQMVPATQFEGICDAFVGVDVPTRERIGEAACSILDQACISFTIDHHAVDTTMADYVYVDPDAAAACMLIWELTAHLGVDRSGDLATCCYTGLCTDTGRFQFQNTDALAMHAGAEMVDAGANPAAVACQVFQNRTLPSLKLECAALERMTFGASGQYVISWLSSDDFERFGAIKADAEPVINAIRSVQGTRVACLLREVDGKVRGGLRSKDDTDISILARKLGGGGHKAASGFTLDTTLERAISQLQHELDLMFSKQEA